MSEREKLIDLIVEKVAQLMRKGLLSTEEDLRAAVEIAFEESDVILSTEM